MTPDEIAAGAIERYAAQKHSELSRFIDFMMDRPVPQTVVEIGTLRGGTLWAWSQIAADDATLISVDLPGGDFGGGYDESYAETLREYVKPTQDLVLIRGNSHDPEIAGSVDDALDVPLDFLFIDGDHTFMGALADWMIYAPLVRHGGVVAFHDVLFHNVDTRCRVDAVWDYLKEVSVRPRFYEFCSPEERHPEWDMWGGIGALVV